MIPLSKHTLFDNKISGRDVLQELVEPGILQDWAEIESQQKTRGGWRSFPIKQNNQPKTLGELMTAGNARINWGEFSGNGP